MDRVYLSIAGTYSSTNTYQVNDVVPYNGLFYLCTTADTTGVTPSASSANWEVLGSQSIMRKLTVTCASNSGTAYTGSLPANAPQSAYQANDLYTVVIDVANTGTSTLQIGTMAATPFRKKSSGGIVELASGDLQPGPVLAVYDGTQFLLLAPLAGGGSATGTAATYNIGTSGATVPLLNGNGNVWSNTQTMPAVAAAANGNYGTLSLGSLGGAPVFTRTTNDAQPAFMVNLAGPSSTAAFISTFKNQGTDVAGVTPLGAFLSKSQVLNGIQAQTAAYTCTGADDLVLANGTFTVTLEAAPLKGQARRVKNTGTGTITISGNGKNIDGGTSASLTAQYQSMTLRYDGTQWWIV